MFAGEPVSKPVGVAALAHWHPALNPLDRIGWNSLINTLAARRIG